MTRLNAHRRNGLIGHMVALIVLLGSSMAVFAAPAINTLKPGVFSSSETDTAILGYDTVAYFTDDKAVPGNDQHVYEWMDAKWKFSSAENLEKFKADPEKYAPQYGGYCAYAVAKGDLVKIDPEAYAVIDDKLYLNYDQGIQKKWAKDSAGYIKSADQKFDGLIKE